MKLSLQVTIAVAIIFSFSCVFKITAQETQSGPTSKNQEKKMNTGIVTGKVSFGPLRPGPVRLGDSDDSAESKEILQRMYSTHKVKVLSEDGKKTIDEVEIDKEGKYKAELSPGTYQLQISPAFARFQKQTVTVEVTAGKSITADISVDTGIR